MSQEIPPSPEQELAQLREEKKQWLEEKESFIQKQEALEKENAELTKVALKDPLTDTLNRRGLKETAATVFAQRSETDPERRERQKPIAVLMLDIDDFKAVNDVYGHPEGDRILREVAEFLKKNVCGSDIVARMGGEEFAIIFNNTEDQDIFNKFFDKNEGVSRVGFNTELGGIKDHRVTLSGGVTMFKPDETVNDLDVALERADTALYASKKNGKDHLTIFTEDLKSNPTA